MEKLKFPIGLSAVLHQHERILELYKFNDLQEVYNLKGLDDEWDIYKDGNREWELNFYRDKEGFRLSLYGVNEYSENIDIKIEVE